MSGDCLFRFCLGPEAGSSLFKLAEKNAIVPGVLDDAKNSGAVDILPKFVCKQS